VGKQQNATLPSVLRDMQGRREPFIGQTGRPAPVKRNALWIKRKRCPTQVQGLAFKLKVISGRQQLHWDLKAGR